MMGRRYNSRGPKNTVIAKRRRRMKKMRENLLKLATSSLGPSSCQNPETESDELTIPRFYDTTSIGMEIKTEFEEHYYPNLYPDDVQKLQTFNSTYGGITVKENEDLISPSPFEYVNVSSKHQFQTRVEIPGDLGHLVVPKEEELSYDCGYDDTLQRNEDEDPLRYFPSENIKEEVDGVEYILEGNEDEDPLSHFEIEANVKEEELQCEEEFREPLIVENGRYDTELSNPQHRNPRDPVKCVSKPKSSNDEKRQNKNCRVKQKTCTSKSNLKDKVGVNADTFVPNIRKRSHKCEICGRCFSLPLSLSAHKKLHEGARGYECDICGKSFSGLSQLTSHGKIHTREYECETCGQRFTHNPELIRHKSRCHGEKPYMCDVCGVGFVKLAYLFTHKNIHPGENGYKCETCGVKFYNYYIFKAHFN